MYEIASRTYYKYNTFNPSEEPLALHEYRTQLEPYVYMHLIEKYGTMLQAHWEHYIPPTKSNYAAVIVERRIHPNFRFILQNIAWAAPYMSVYIFCSDVNKAFIHAILGDKKDNFRIIEAFIGNPSRTEAIKDYNNLLTMSTFYETIDANYMLTVQMDNIIRKKLPLSIFTGDYWGNPWFWDKLQAGGGGATIRRVSYMIDLCKKYRPDISIQNESNEDSWISDKTITFPSIETRTEFSMESVPADDPYILHQFWTFANPYIDLGKDIFINYWSHLLTIS